MRYLKQLLLFAKAGFRETFGHGFKQGDNGLLDRFWEKVQPYNFDFWKEGDYRIQLGCFIERLQGMLLSKEVEVAELCVLFLQPQRTN